MRASGFQVILVHLLSADRLSSFRYSFPFLFYIAVMSLSVATPLDARTQGREAVLSKNDNDVVIVAVTRTALTKGKKGGFKDTPPEDLLVAVLKDIVKRSGIDVNLIEETHVGTVLPPCGGQANLARMAQFAAGYPVTSTVNTVNRQCASGLTAFNHVALQVATGQIDIGVAAGVESMSQGYFTNLMPEKLSDKVLEVKTAADCLIPMGLTSENVASRFGITRQQQDEYAVLSHSRAAQAQKDGKFRDEIVPVEVTWEDPKTGEEKTIVVEHDDGIRAGVTLEALSKLKPAFSKKGSTHAGNASQISDGAAAALITRRSIAKKLGLPIVAKYVTASLAGVEPDIMGIGPAVVIPKVLKQAHLTLDDIDFYEINEAFASQLVYSIEKLNIPREKVNINGGAIAFGHPFGCTGVRQIATGLGVAKQTGAKIFITSMCIGSGMGMAAIFVNEQ